MPEYTKAYFKEELTKKLCQSFACTPQQASDVLFFQAAALVLRDILSQRQVLGADDPAPPVRQVHYLSMEFLLGRSLLKNAYNLGVVEPLTEALTDLGADVPAAFEAEPDAGLGNGGLGRLAACYLDSMTTLNIPATGYSICYELGIFKQRIQNGQQAELPDDWLERSHVWLMEKTEETEEVRFGGTVSEGWENGRLRVSHDGYTTVLAIPRDMAISGFQTNHVNLLRLWDAKAKTPVDMSYYARGEYLKAVEERAMAEVISKVLYPGDDHYEGKALRLKQQYFFVSATVQSIARQHRSTYGSLTNLHEAHVIQINDTHGALAIPELMRILLDNEGLQWDAAWQIVTRTVCYTNHTVMREALERWPQGLMESLLPRIWSILREIDRRFVGELSAFFPEGHQERQVLAILWDGEVRMANLCVAACFAVNGVSALHSDILKKEVFPAAHEMMPGKFRNVTNGIDHRRWLSQANPRLASFVTGLLGSDAYCLQPERLKDLERYQSDTWVIEQLGRIKRENKEDLAARLFKDQGIVLCPQSIFDVQVKRMHEYKRQLLNVLHILSLYRRLQEDRSFDMVPHTFLFGAKAAPGYYVAKEIIRLIVSISRKINSDPICKDRLQVHFLENYNVSLAEGLIPASELSQQISTAGKEASGTGNMKFMLNGALTIGTLDGANVEMHQAVGDENMFLFGLTASQVSEKKASGYHPLEIASQNEDLQQALRALQEGFGDGVSYGELAHRLLHGRGGPADEYMLLADFASYQAAHQSADALYRDPLRWNQMALINIANAGIFAADRSIRDYAASIWNVPYRQI